MTNPQFWFGADYIIGLRSWFRNFTHSHILEYGPVDLATIRCPYVEYFIYSLFKSVQVASFVGGLIMAPAYRRYRWKVLKQDQITKNSSKVIKAASKQLQGRILLGSIFSTPLLMGASVYINGYTTETLAMRCYEIRCGELTHDRTTVFMAWLGWYCKRFQGAVDGINCALLYTIVDKKVLRKYFNPIDMDSVYRKGLTTYQDLDEPQMDSTTLFQFVKKKMLEGGMTQLRKNTSQSDEKPVEK